MSDLKLAEIPTDLQQQLMNLEKAALAAAAILIDAGTARSHSFLSVERWRKKDATLLTSLDLACEKTIFKRLGDTIPIVSEENEDSHSQIRSSLEEFILVDPIDGTTACTRFLTTRGGQVGFGPLLGYVQQKKIVCATYYNVPERTLYSAIKGHGVYACLMERPLAAGRVSPLDERLRLNRTSSLQDADGKVIPGLHPGTLQDAVALFYIGRAGEGALIDRLKSRGTLLNFYRFGGFANDCTRLANSLEDIQIQFAVKAWDLSAALFCYEAGYQVVLDPHNDTVPFDQWEVALENPLVTAPPHLIEELISLVKEREVWAHE